MKKFQFDNSKTFEKMTTEFIKKSDGRIVMKLHNTPDNLKKSFTEKDFDFGFKDESFHIVVYINKYEQIAQYSPIEPDMDFTKFYHRHASMALVTDFIGSVYSVREKRLKAEQEARQAEAAKAANKKKKSSKK